MDELNRLLNEGWEYCGSVACGAHGGDHEADLYCDPKNSKSDPREYCPKEQTFNN